MSAATEERQGPDRRTYLQHLVGWVMAGGLFAAYGTLAGFIGRFLYPSRRAQRAWLYVRDVAGIATGEALAYRLPDGNPVTITRRGDGGRAEDFMALSSTCPHLGCQVHWEAHNERFFCPCHNGVFTPDGTAVEGPPADAGQTLPRYPLRVDGGLLYLEVPMALAAAGPLRFEGPSGPPAHPTGPGHDPCLCGGDPEAAA